MFVVDWMDEEEKAIPHKDDRWLTEDIDSIGKWNIAQVLLDMIRRW